MIKVAHFVCGLKSGGVEQMLLNYCSHMDQKKFSFTVIYQHDPDPICLEKFKKENFQIYRIASKAHHPFKNIKQTYQNLKENQYDIIHCHMTLMNFIPLLCAKICGVKVRISHSHNAKEPSKNIFEWICKKLVKAFSTSNFSCGDEAAIFLYGTTKDVCMINNAIDVTKFKYNSFKRDSMREKYQMKESFIIGHIGRFMPQKNHMFLLDVFEKVYQKNPQAYLFLIGNGELQNKIRAVAREKNVDKNILFVGTVSNVQDFYQMMDVFVLPSLWEGLPVASIEAQTSGLPVLLSNKITTNAQINSRTQFLPLDVNIWVQEVLKLCQNKERPYPIEKINDLGYNIEKEAQKLEAFYLQSLNE